LKSALSGINGLNVHGNDSLALDAVGLCDCFPKKSNGFRELENTRELEEHGLHDCVDSASKANIVCNGGGINDIELDFLGCNVTFQISRELCLQLLWFPWSVKNKDTSRLDVAEKLVLVNIWSKMACNVICCQDEIL